MSVRVSARTRWLAGYGSVAQCPAAAMGAPQPYNGEAAGPGAPLERHLMNEDNSPRNALGIDAGGSSAGWLLVDATGETVAQGRTGAITGHVFVPGGDELSSEGERSADNLARIIAEAAAHGPVGAVAMGTTGLEHGSRSAVHFERFIAEKLQERGSPAAHVFVTNDMEVAYRTSFAPGEGVLVYGGTGSVAWHVPRSGPSLRVGGHGYLIDDAGGGYWIGRAALGQVLRWADEQGGPSRRPLAREVYAQLGVSDWDGIREDIYTAGRSRVAQLSRAVARAAARGDEAALGIQRAAGEELARLANVALARLGAIMPVALAGGVINQGQVLVDALAARLPAGAELRISGEDPAVGAARLALSPKSAVAP